MIRNILKEKKGATLLIAIVIMIVVVALSMALILISRSLYTTVSERRDMEQCKQVTQDLSDAIESELISVKKSNQGNLDKLKSMAQSNQRDLWLFLRCNLWQTTWPDYDNDKRGHIMDYAEKVMEIDYTPNSETADEISRIEELVDSTQIKMYWVNNEDNNREEPITLVVKVVCKKNGSKSILSTTYELKIEGYDSQAAGSDLSSISELAGYGIDAARSTIYPNEIWTFSFEDRG